MKLLLIQLASFQESVNSWLANFFLLAIVNRLSLSLASPDPFKLIELKASFSMSRSKSIILKAWLIELSILCVAFF